MAPSRVQQVNLVELKSQMLRGTLVRGLVKEMRIFALAPQMTPLRKFTAAAGHGTKRAAKHAGGAIAGGSTRSTAQTVPTLDPRTALPAAEALFGRAKSVGLDIGTIQRSYLDLIENQSLKPLQKSEPEVGYFAAAVKNKIEEGTPWNEHTKQQFLGLFKKPQDLSLLDLSQSWQLSKDPLETVRVISDPYVFGDLKARHDRSLPPRLHRGDALKEARGSLSPSSVVVLCGNSGGGKTITAAALPLAIDDKKGPLLVYCRASDVFPQNIPSDKARRNAVVKRRMLAYAERLVPQTHRRAPPGCTEPALVVLVVDEAGTHAAAVRGLCATVTTLCEDLEAKVFPGCRVRLVVVGTGAEGATLAPGSMPNTYRVVRVRVPAWATLEQNLRVEGLGAVLDELNDAHPTMQLARAMTTNARAAVLFYHVLREWVDMVAFAPTEASRRSVRDMCAAAALRAMRAFVKQNSLSQLSLRGLRYNLMRAIVTQFYKGDLKTDVRDQLFSVFGLVEDRAERVKKVNRSTEEELQRPTKSVDGGGRIVLKKAYLGQRYAVDPAVLRLISPC